MPQTRVAIVGIILQDAEVHGLNEDPGGSANYSWLQFLKVESDGKVHGDVIAVLQFVHYGVHSLRLVLEELQVSPVEEGGAS